MQAGHAQCGPGGATEGLRAGGRVPSRAPRGQVHHAPDGDQASYQQGDASPARSFVIQDGRHHGGPASARVAGAANRQAESWRSGGDVRGVQESRQVLRGRQHADAQVRHVPAVGRVASDAQRDVFSVHDALRGAAGDVPHTIRGGGMGTDIGAQLLRALDGAQRAHWVRPGVLDAAGAWAPAESLASVRRLCSHG